MAAKKLLPLFQDKTSVGIPLAEDPLSDFRRFLYVVWKHLKLPEPTPVQYDMANTLQILARGGDLTGARIVIEGFRGVAKSWISSAFTVWLLYMNPSLNILVVSASKQRADEFTTFTLRLIKEMEILSHLIPDKDQRQSAVAFDVRPARASHNPSVKSVGIGGQLAGNRADVIIPDDIEVMNNSATQGMRDHLAECIKEFDAIIKPGGRICFLGTPQSEMSIYNLLPERGYKVFIYPARVPTAKQVEAYGNKLAPFIRKMLETRDAGLSTDPLRFSDLDLSERELSYGRSGFALQFMLDTSLSDADRYPLRLSDLIVMDLNANMAPEGVIWSRAQVNRLDLPSVGFQGDAYHSPLEVLGKWGEYDGSVMVIDPSGRGKDETAYAVVKAKVASLYLTAAGGFLGGYTPETLRALAEIAKAQQVQKIIVETNFGDGMFSELLKPYLREVGYGVTIEEERAKGQKELRIVNALEPVMNQHRLIVDRAVVERDWDSTKGRPADEQLVYQLFYQMTRVTKERGALVHDDRLDALASGVAYWVNRMAIDQGEEIANAREEELMEIVRQTLENVELGLAVMRSPNHEYDTGVSMLSWRPGQ